MTQGIIPPNVLLSGYCTGIFPMADSATGEIHWYEPHIRAIFPLDGLNISRSLRRTLQKNIFDMRVDTAFEDVMRACAERDETWISGSIIASYTTLFKMKYAHSVESWCKGKLVGGLYGVSIGGAFFGESMFSMVTDASKAALVVLVRRLRERGYRLLDAQFQTPHLKSLGAVEIPQKEYLKKLERALEYQCTFEG
ncbi:MAG: leucyl/phenylalanyl-tRNA--protein transferase [Ignavibacteriales bacterium]|nr:leucyl/phenylalanyl-tRNA--protein transferase [Ignavibacteriales bacterium]